MIGKLNWFSIILLILMVMGGIGSVNAETVEESATHLSNLDLSDVPQWSDAAIEWYFEYIRDTRWLHEDGDMYLPERRISWLYPDEGCEVRAELAIGMGYWLDPALKPFKLWAIDIYDDLGLFFVSNNAFPGRWSRWNYHVAPVVKNSVGSLIVLDPAINPNRPLFWEDWLATMVDDFYNSFNIEGGRYQVALSDSCAYERDDQTRGDGGCADHYNQAFQEMEYDLLLEEWERQVSDLDRDSYDYFYDYYPDWVNGTKYEAEDTIHTVQNTNLGGPIGDYAWNQYCNGNIYFEYSFTGGDQTIRILASGSYAGGANPEMRIDITDAYNNVYYSDSRTVTAGGWNWYTFTIEAPVGCHAVKIYFVNDYWNPPNEDRNLYIDVIEMPCSN